MKYKLVTIRYIPLSYNTKVLPNTYIQCKENIILNKYFSYLLLILVILLSILNTTNCQEFNFSTIDSSKITTYTKSYFVIDDEPFKFVGGFIPGWHFGDSHCTVEMNEDLMKTAKENGINVLHVMMPGIEKELGVFDSMEVNKLDRFINCASKYGIYIMPAIIHGLGIAVQQQHQYYHPHGIEGLVKDSVLKNAFKDRLFFLTNHKNMISGIKYSDDPTILAWILIEEPISAFWNYPQGPPSVTIEELNNWFEEMAVHIKVTDTNHYVTVFTTAAIDALGTDWPNVFKSEFLDFYYSEDADMRILNLFHNPDDYPMCLFQFNKPMVMGISVRADSDICHDYPLQSQLLYDAMSTYIDTGATGCIVQRWGSSLYPFIPEFDSCYSYNSTYDTICYTFREIAKYTGSFQYPAPPLKFAHIKTTTKIYIDTSICKGQRYYTGGDYQSLEGIYYDTLSRSNNYDSILITNLSINPTFNVMIDTSICQGMSYFGGGDFHTISGIYYDTLQTIYGCDSVIINELTVHPIYETNLRSEICEGDSILLGGELRTKSGSYYDTLLTQHDCDSIIVFNLTVNACNDIGLMNDDERIKVYPVPTDGLINIKYKHIKYIELYNNSGVLLLKTDNNYINFKKYSKGIYYLNIFDTNNSIIRRTIIYY